MKRDKPIEINLLDFFKTGKFDHLKLGQTKAWVLNNFPDPDGRFDVDMQNNGFDIWTYGDIELHFENQKLFLIYSDNLGSLSGGNDLKFNKWIFEDFEKLNLLYVMKKLNECDIDYKKKTDKLGVLLRISSGIELTFENIDDKEPLSSNEFILTSFGLVAENPYRWK